MNYAEVVETVREIIREYDFRLTVRQIYYRVISPPYQLFGNTINNYKGFDKILTRARERGDIDWKKIEDRSRSLIGGEDTVFDTPAEFVDTYLSYVTSRWYNESWWKDQSKHVEVWVEKDALASLFANAVRDYGVYVYPNRGYSSFTKIAEALERWDHTGKQDIVILHFGDHDPSGVDMTRDLQDRIERYIYENRYDFDVSVKRKALTINQVQNYNLEANPTKHADARSAAYVREFGDQCWELDAYPPNDLTTLIKDMVAREIDQATLQASLDRMNGRKEKIQEVLDKYEDEYNELIDRIKEDIE